MNQKKNCWEVKQCGREPGGIKVDELGICPATIAIRLDGTHGGENAGRACWAVAGSMCGGEVQGIYAEKYASCIKCDFYMKVQSEEKAKFEMTSTLVLKLQSAKVLLIDNENIISERLKNILTTKGYEVSVAESGEAGMRIFKKEHPDIVLTGIKLPGMNGLDVLTKVKKMAPQTEVIMITGHEGAESAISALRGGAYDYITQPISIDELEISMSRALERQIVLIENKKMLEVTQRLNEELQQKLLEISELSNLDK